MKKALLLLLLIFPSFLFAQTDAGVISIDSVRARCGGMTDVYATVQNFGIGTLSTFDLDWEIDGVGQAGTSYSGSLAPGATMQLLLGSFNMLVDTLYDIAAWTSSPNGVTDNDASNDSTVMNEVGSGLNGLYYVNIISPADFYSIYDVADALFNRGVCGPTSIVLDVGLMNLKLRIHDVVGTSAVNTVEFSTIVSDSTQFILEYPSTAFPDSNYVVSIQNASYITFRHMTFSRTGTEENSTAVQIDGNSSHISFKNCRFIGPSSFTTTNTTGTQSAIFNPGTDDWDGLEVRNCYFQNNSNGLWVNGSMTHDAQNTVIENNVFETFYVGAFILYQDAPVISGNTIVRNSLTSTVDFYPISVRYGVGAIQITNNKITGYTGSYGIRLRSFIAPPPFNGLIANNFVQVGGSSIGRGISLEESCAGIDIFHNSVNTTGGNSTFGRAMVVEGPSTANLRILNNIFVNTSTGYAYYVATTATTGVTLSDHNCLSTSGTNLAFWGGDYANLPALQAATSMDAHSVNGNPLFVSASDLHASAGILANAGSSIPAIAFDIDGDARDLATPDIGADEFTPVGIESVFGGNDWHIYPNPASDYLYMELQASQSGYFRICDLSGKELFVENVNQGLNSILIPENIRTGVYFAYLLTENGIITTPILIAK